MRIRYSFRVLLVIFTLLIVGVGVFAVRWHRTTRQRELVAALRAANASVSYAYEASNGEPVMNVADPLAENSQRGYPEVSRWRVLLGRQFGRDFVFDVAGVQARSPLSAKLVTGLSQLRGLNYLHLNAGKEFEDEAWRALVGCRQIECLTLQREHFEPTRRLAGLSALRQLKSLTVENGELTVEDVQEIAAIRELRELKFSLVGVTDDSLQPLAQLKNLERLSLTHRGHGQDVTAAGVEFLAHMPQLRLLDLARIVSLNDDVIPRLETLAKLESLSLDSATIHGANLHRLARLPRLKTLNLIGTKVDDRAIQQLAGLAQLETLDISFTEVTDAGLKYVVSLTRLRHLTVSGNAITDEGAQAISRLTQLEELALTNTNVSDVGLKSLHALPKLRALRLNDNLRMTKAGVTQLKAALPRCSVY